MVTAVFRGSSNHYNPDEPRDSRGRWTSGGTSSTDWALHDPSEVGRAGTLLGHGRFGLYPKFVLPTVDEARDFARLLRAWNAASSLDDQSFHNLFVGDKLASLATTRFMREAARKAAAADTIDQMIEASRPLTAAIKDIGPGRWPHVLNGLERQASAVVEERDFQNGKNAPSGLLDWIAPSSHHDDSKTSEGPLDDIAKTVNPTNDSENCGFIADAVVARLRRNDSGVVAKTGRDGTWPEIRNRFKITFKLGSFDEIFKRVRDGGDGTIAIIGIIFPKKGSRDLSDRSHVLVIANYEGRVGIVEGGTGKNQETGEMYPPKAIYSADEANKRYNSTGYSSISYGIVPP